MEEEKEKIRDFGSWEVCFNLCLSPSWTLSCEAYFDSLSLWIHLLLDFHPFRTAAALKYKPAQIRHRRSHLGTLCNAVAPSPPAHCGAAEIASSPSPLFFQRQTFASPEPKNNEDAARCLKLSEIWRLCVHLRPTANYKGLGAELMREKKKQKLFKWMSLFPLRQGGRLDRWGESVHSVSGKWQYEEGIQNSSHGFNCSFNRAFDSKNILPKNWDTVYETNILLVSWLFKLHLFIEKAASLHISYIHLFDDHPPCNAATKFPCAGLELNKLCALIAPQARLLAADAESRPDSEMQIPPELL